MFDCFFFSLTSRGDEQRERGHKPDVGHRDVVLVVGGHRDADPESSEGGQDDHLGGRTLRPLLHACAPHQHAQVRTLLPTIPAEPEHPASPAHAIDCIGTSARLLWNEREHGLVSDINLYFNSDKSFDSVFSIHGYKTLGIAEWSGILFGQGDVWDTYTTGLPQTQLTTVVSLISHWLCYANSAVNPIIYNFMNGKFRREFRKSFCYLCTTEVETPTPTVMTQTLKGI
ncbi:hypothetical protein AVEN_175276-1 [Araneus ventricosus]|uniref:G-protein coupled receptors family 1 profile domain-containing protein n=1 Tax=Araneus ventricosus TaxID=182803 RepID=A0A4Y2F102_ARAVE|nr:hypothetical protein AVEN_175276-1 [Araneus ventricosus]